MDVEIHAPASGFINGDFDAWWFDNGETADDNNNMSYEELLWLEEQQVSEEEEDEVWDSDDDFNFHNYHEPATNTQNAQQLHNAPNAKPNLTNENRTQIVINILKVADKSCKVPKGHFKNVATQYNIDRSTVYRIWKKAKNKISQHGIVDVRNAKKGRSGRKPKIWDEEMLKAIPQKQRTTIRQFAAALGVSTSTIVRLMRRGVIRSHTSNIRPTLKEHHKTHRLQFILSKIIPSNVRCAPRFELMFNIIHIDEKNFLGSKVSQRYYLTTDEIEPYRHTQSKNFIEKIMFLAAIARPIFGQNNECKFDGKIGIWPFTQEHVAVRTTANQTAGDIIIKPAKSVTKDAIREKIVNCLIPAIKAKWPSWATKCIFIQQDNARPHISPNDPAFLAVANSDGFNIQLTYQPAQSPELNCLDLGFFNAIQSIQYKKFPKNVTELIKAVEEAYYEYDPKKINYTWLQLQHVMLEVLNCKGGNNFKMPHKGKEKLDRIGELPITIEVQQRIIDDTNNYLNEGQIQLQTTGEENQ